MTIHRLLRWSLVLVVLAAFAVWLEPTHVVWGWLRGAAFYQGRPTSWWAIELGRWDLVVVHAHMNMDGIKGCRRLIDYEREDSSFEKLCKKGFRDDTPRETPGGAHGGPYGGSRPRRACASSKRTGANHGPARAGPA